MKNAFNIRGDGTVEIETIQGQTILIDAEDLPLVFRHDWYAIHIDAKYWHAITTDRVLMSRLILDAPASRVVDHVNHNTLDNRRCNLRLATKSQNAANAKRQKGRSSEYKGVAWFKPKQAWQAYIRVNYKMRRIGLFDDEVEAARAYNVAALEAFGEFARLNPV